MGAGLTGLGMPTLPVPAQGTVQNVFAAGTGGNVAGVVPGANVTSAGPLTVPRRNRAAELQKLIGNKLQMRPFAEDSDEERERKAAEMAEKKLNARERKQPAGDAATEAPRTKRTKTTPEGSSSAGAQGDDLEKLECATEWKAAALRKQRGQALGQ